MLIRYLLFADDCALLAHTVDDIQAITKAFAISARRFGLTISLKKTEVIYQPKPGADYTAPTITIDNNPLNVVDKFTYLGSPLSQNALIDDEISARSGKASWSFGKLTKRLWRERGVRLATQINVYCAVVPPTLLRGCEAWTPYRRHTRRLDQFHMRCLRRIANIKWQDMIPNSEVLQRCAQIGIEHHIKRAQLRWSGHFGIVEQPLSRNTSIVSGLPLTRPSAVIIPLFCSEAKATISFTWYFFHSCLRCIVDLHLAL